MKFSIHETLFGLSQFKKITSKIMSKKSFLIIVIILGFTAKNSFSQDNTKVLFNVPKVKQFGFYIAPEYQYGQISNEYTSFRGISAMVVLNNRLGMGIATQTISSQTFAPASINSDPLSSTIYSLQSRFTGLKFEYIFVMLVNRYVEW